MQVFREIERGQIDAVPSRSGALFVFIDKRSTRAKILTMLLAGGARTGPRLPFARALRGREDAFDERAGGRMSFVRGKQPVVLGLGEGARSWWCS
jgi:hypothetical protein